MIKSIFFVLICSQSLSQKVVPFIDFNQYFKTFENGFFKQLEFQPIRDYKAGDDFVAYTDTRGNLRIYDGVDRKDISNMLFTYQVSDHLMAYNIGPTLNLWDAGKLQTLTYNSKEYVVKDSIVVYEDTRYNSVNVYWRNKKTPIYNVTGDLYMPKAIGDNIVVYKDNGDFYKIFYKGEFYNIGVWIGDIQFSVGTDVLAYNDPITRTFTVFYKGKFFDAESLFMQKFKAGRGFVAYEDANGNLCRFTSSKEMVSDFSPRFWDVNDDVILWDENARMHAYSKNGVHEVSNFIPKDYKIKNNVVAFRNIYGGVSALVDGKVYEITNVNDAEYEIYGNTVLVKMFNHNYIVLSDGKKFTN